MPTIRSLSPLLSARPWAVVVFGLGASLSLRNSLVRIQPRAKFTLCFHLNYTVFYSLSRWPFCVPTVRKRRRILILDPTGFTHAFALKASSTERLLWAFVGSESVTVTRN